MTAALAAAPRRERRMTIAEVVAEIDWLRAAGTHPDHIARQFGVRPSALRRRLERHGYNRHAAMFHRPEWWEVSR